MKHIVIFIISLILFNNLLFAQSNINQVDNKGLKQGEWIKKDPKTNLVVYKGQFKDNKPIGVFKYFHENTDLIKSEIKFKDDGKTAYAEIFNTSGKIQAKGKYIDEKRDSVWNFYSEFGELISKENYKNGNKEGQSFIYYPNGQLFEEINFKNDLKDGANKQYYENKQLKSESNYKNGKLIGKNAYYYPNGMVASVGIYNQLGNKNGVWLTKDKDGKTTEKEVYDNGKLLQGKAAEDWIKNNKNKENPTSKIEKKKEK
jgi:antitoxin component YwqK of YwqJK toxin-antitoxin module